MGRKVKYKKPTYLTAKKIQTRDVLQDITKLIYPRGEAIAIPVQKAPETLDVEDC